MNHERALEADRKKWNIIGGLIFAVVGALVAGTASLFVLLATDDGPQEVVIVTPTPPEPTAAVPADSPVPTQPEQ